MRVIVCSDEPSGQQERIVLADKGIILNGAKTNSVLFRGLGDGGH